MYTNKIEKIITFEFKTGYYLKLLLPETMKLLRSTKNEITENKNGENTAHLKLRKEYYWSTIKLSTTIINIFKMYKTNFFPINQLDNYWIFHKKMLYF